MSNTGQTLSDVFLPAAKYGYDDFVGISRHILSSAGPIVQYADTFDQAVQTLLPAKGFQNNATQVGSFDTKLLGEGYDPTTFQLGSLQLSPSFEAPILTVLDNVPAGYVFDIFDLCRKAPYGDAIEHVGLVAAVSGTIITLNTRERYLLRALKESVNNNAHTLYVTIVDGLSLKPLTAPQQVTNVSSNNAEVTIGSSVSVSGSYLLAVFVLYKPQTYPLASDVPPNRQGSEMSNEFFLSSSRDGVYYPALVNRVELTLGTELPSIRVSCLAKRINKKKRGVLDPEGHLSQDYPMFSAPRSEQYRIKITGVSGVSLFYGVTPVVQSGTIMAPNPLFDYRSGVHYGDDLNDLTTPEPLLVRSISMSVDNGLSPVYSIHTPRYSTTEGEGYINDLGRFDNSCAYGFFSEGRKIEGQISIVVPVDEWFKKEVLPGLNSNTEGSIEIDTGYINITLDRMVFNLSDDSTDISSQYDKTYSFRFVSTGYDSMFEIKMSKTGGRL